MKTHTLTLTLTIKEVFLPDGDVYWAAFNEEGTKIAPWSDSDTPEEVRRKLLD
jgi:hypothetical protein